MTNQDAFIQCLSKMQKPARRILLSPGEPGQIPRTKVSGIPWWPKTCSRPTCSHGHLMSFMLQILLSDVPTHKMTTDHLLSFHYCTQCMYDGKMAWGFPDIENRSYDVRVFEIVGATEADGLGVVGEATLPTSTVTLSDYLEVPSVDDMPEALQASLPEDYFQGGDYDESDYRGMIHRPTCKIGGWPSWVQSPEWPTIGGRKLDFICQIDAIVGERSAWGGGGHAYLFITPPGVSPRTGELLIQTT